jgi:hypothetical protein
MAALISRSSGLLPRSRCSDRASLLTVGVVAAAVAVARY